MLPSAASLLALALLSTGSERFRGVARLADGRVAYVEEHEVELRDGRPARAETRYLDAAGRPIARLASDYRSAPWAPDYDFLDLRTGASEWVRRSGEGVELGGSGGSRRLVPAGDRPLVAGQGLDRFIRAHLDRLARGERLAVLLALPGRLATYDFRLRAEPLQGRSVRVHVEPASALLRLLAPAISADYDPATGRLLRYRGVSNLAGADGSTQEVEIAYEPGKPSPPVAGSNESLRRSSLAYQRDTRGRRSSRCSRLVRPARSGGLIHRLHAHADSSPS